MGLPNRSAVRSIDTEIKGLQLRLRAFLGDGQVHISRSGSDYPRLAAVDRIDTAMHIPRIAVIDTDALPGLLEAAGAVTAAAIEFYHHPDDYEKPKQAGARPALIVGSPQ